MPLWSRAFKMFYFTDLDKQQFFLFFDLFWSVLSPSGIFTFTETPRHSNFFSAGSFAVRCGVHLWSWDHLRSAMGITCGSGIICGPIWGSFAVGDHLRSRDHLQRCTDRLLILCF